ncbi:MAG: hypothetical protein OXH98_02270 [Caldilineaceae bacterium]|nr:hypothetical protein [Caldilineaceae bacterium]
MLEKKVKIPFGDRHLDAVVVPIKESTERWTDVTLEDGTLLKIKPVIAKVARAVDSYDKDGTPVYSIKVNPVVDVDAPEHLKENAQVSSKEIN